jgi:hypothetical protein
LAWHSCTNKNSKKLEKELREAIFSPEMIWDAVPQCRCSKSERFFTVPCRFDLWLENFIFFDFLVRQMLLLLIMLVPVLSI